MNTKLYLKLLTLMALSSITACASLEQIPDYTQFGTADPQQEAAVVKRYKENKTKTQNVEQDIVLVDSVPEGIDVSEGKITSSTDYQHEIIGKFSLKPDVLSNSSKATTKLAQYEKGSIKALCYPQIPLNFVTFGLWQYVPLNYPCHGSIKTTKEKMINKSKQMTAAAGGDISIISYIKHPDSSVVIGAVGYSIKLDPRMDKSNLSTKKAKLQEEKEL